MTGSIQQSFDLKKTREGFFYTFNLNIKLFDSDCKRTYILKKIVEQVLQYYNIEMILKYNKIPLKITLNC